VLGGLSVLKGHTFTIWPKNPAKKSDLIYAKKLCIVRFLYSSK
jgi:hypothetical protein